ncbi:MAG: T9SS type A sorting domain-containing protein [candidate division Zixibacteria bacterium]|nr:T9SS type A sorting domain-containing protein [candidate division Zixibacteria bacterium]
MDSTNAGGTDLGVFNIAELKRISADLTPTAIFDDQAAEGLPLGFALENAFPNPFNPATTIAYYLPEGAQVRLVVYNILGQQVKVLLDNVKQTAGSYQIVWDCRNEHHQPVGNGIYLYRLTAGDFGQSKKMVLLK